MARHALIDGRCRAVNQAKQLMLQLNGLSVRRDPEKQRNDNSRGKIDEGSDQSVINWRSRVRCRRKIKVEGKYRAVFDADN